MINGIPDFSSVNNNSITNTSSPSNDASSSTVATTSFDLAPTITQNLQSTKVSDKIIGVKTLLAIMSKGENVSSFFPLVVQEISSDDETLRHLSYVYLVHYAEADPDSALMSVNTFQRSLSDPDPIVRALSLKILSSIRSQEIIEIVLEAVQTCVTDMSPYVRKAAALALVKIYETDSTSLNSVVNVLTKLLRDQSIITISGALFALTRISPDNDKLIHPIFRTLCRILPRLDPWGQSTALHILQRYARRNFKAPSEKVDWFNEEEDNDTSNILNGQQDPNTDLDLLIKNTQPLLNSITPSVTFAAASLFFYCAPPFKQHLIAKPMIRLLYADASTSFAALKAISSFVADNPEPFIPQISHFFLGYDDTIPIKKLKLQILSQLARPMNSDILIRQLAQHIHDSDRDIAAEAIKAVGRTASLAGDAAPSCINVIIKMLSSSSSSVVNQAIQMLVLLLRPLPKTTVSFSNSSSTETNSNDQNIDDVFKAADSMDEMEVKTVLTKMLSVFSRIDDPTTKAAFVSLVGDKALLIPLQAHEVLRQLAMTFASQPDEVKLQAVSLAAKLIAVRPKEVSDLTRYVFTLGFYDNNIDVRDRARLLHVLLTAPPTQQNQQNQSQQNQEAKYIAALRQVGKAREFLFPKKPDVVWTGDVAKASVVEVGTFSSMFGKVISKTSAVVEWADPSEIPKASVRDEEVNSSINGGNDDDDDGGHLGGNDEDDDLDSFFDRPATKKKTHAAQPILGLSQKTGEGNEGENENEINNLSLSNDNENENDDDNEKIFQIEQPQPQSQQQQPQQQQQQQNLDLSLEQENDENNFENVDDYFS